MGKRMIADNLTLQNREDNTFCHITVKVDYSFSLETRWAHISFRHGHH